MAAIWPDEGEVEMLRRMLTPQSGDSLPLKLGLFTHIPGPIVGSTTLADLTVATFAGYAPKDLDPATWAPPQSFVGVAQSQYGPSFLTWLSSAGSQAVIGYYVTDNAGAILLWLELFPIAVTVTPTTPASVYPYVRLRSLF